MPNLPEATIQFVELGSPRDPEEQLHVCVLPMLRRHLSSPPVELSSEQKGQAWHRNDDPASKPASQFSLAHLVSHISCNIGSSARFPRLRCFAAERDTAINTHSSSTCRPSHICPPDRPSPIVMASGLNAVCTARVFGCSSCRSLSLGWFRRPKTH